LKLLILVKTVALFIREHIRHIRPDLALENDVYQLIVHNILGTYPYNQVPLSTLRNSP